MNKTMIAMKDGVRYKAKRINLGERFEAGAVDARIYKALKWAEEVPQSVLDEEAAAEEAAKSKGKGKRKTEDDSAQKEDVAANDEPSEDGKQHYKTRNLTAK